MQDSFQHGTGGAFAIGATHCDDREVRLEPQPIAHPDDPLETEFDGLGMDLPVVDAYYGLVQIQAVVQGGRLAGIKVLQYPSDRRTSVFINRQALPMLRDEVVTAQSANVDIISGATLTSEAFIRSLDAALRQAKS